jgi:ATP-dependent Lon protease
LMETGLISETKVRKTRQLELVSRVFATANNFEKIIEPLLSRFLVLEVPDYTFEEFKAIAISRLTKEKVDKQVACVIAEKVWNELDSRDIRDAIKVGRLVSNIQEVSSIVRMMKRQLHN